MDRDHTCCFTGHRTERLPWGENENDPRCLELKDRLDEALAQAYAEGFRHFVCGMARGSDLYFCEAALALRQLHPEVTLEAAVPYQGQADRWPETDRRRWELLLSQCNFETVVQHHYSAGCLSRRNRYMADKSALLLAVYDGRPHGGAAYTLQYARNHGLRTVVLDVEAETRQQKNAP